MMRLWPSVDNAKAAESAALGATSACLLIAVTDLAIGITAMVTHHPAIGLDEWVIVDAIAFLTIGAYIFWKHSRVAAVMGLLLFMVEAAFKISQEGIKFHPIQFVFLLCFLHGIRGTFACADWAYAERS
jgi:hypothetical protein